MKIGIIGAGQLGQMLGAAANALGHECGFLDPSAEPPAAREGRVIQAAFDDAAALRELASSSDVISYEFENVPVSTLAEIDTRHSIYPPPAALSAAQDRLDEKRLLEALGIDLPGYRAVDSQSGLQAAAAEMGLPIVLKTRRFGYDGKGQLVLRNTADLGKAWESLGDRALIAEEFVPFDFEVSVIGARSMHGDVAIWPLTRNEHSEGILRCSVAPIDEPELTHLAHDYIKRLLTQLDYVGVLALELFVANGRLLANEFAPRVHNSGHWTIEGATTSQFENHVRAITGTALGETGCKGHAGMVNLIGGISSASRSLANGRIHLHDYGKSARPGRKLGHLTVLADSPGKRDDLMHKALKTVT